VAPTAVEYVLAPQDEHEAAPEAEYVPAPHVVHVPPFVPDVPALQTQLAKVPLFAGDAEFDGHPVHVTYF